MIALCPSIRSNPGTEFAPFDLTAVMSAVLHAVPTLLRGRGVREVLSVSTVDLSYRRRGSGEPLLLIHGTGSNLRAWAPVFGLPASRRDVIAVDLPGHGDSPLAPAGTPPTAANFARLISTRLP